LLDYPPLLQSVRHQSSHHRPEHRRPGRWTVASTDNFDPDERNRTTDDTDDAEAHRPAGGGGGGITVIDLSHCRPGYEMSTTTLLISAKKILFPKRLLLLLLHLLLPSCKRDLKLYYEPLGIS
jgi:hypothetical protein